MRQYELTKGKNIHILVPQSIKEKLKEMNEYYIIKISKAEIIAINVNGN